MTKRERKLERHIRDLETLLDCRAGRLLRKGASFIVIRDDEPYYARAYGMIRSHECFIGRWNDEDETAYRVAMLGVTR